MPCNNGGCRPLAKIEVENVGTDMIVLQDVSVWSDGFTHDNNRKGLWIIYQNGVEVARTTMSLLFVSVAIGDNSTAKNLYLPNGIQDVIDYLNLQGITVADTDQIEISRIVTNSCNRESIESDKVDLGTLAQPVTYSFPLIVGAIIPLVAPLKNDGDCGCKKKQEDCDCQKEEVIQTHQPFLAELTIGDPACPIDYAVYQFDFSFYGGTTGETFVDEAALIARFAVLNPVAGTYTLNATTCALEVTSLTPPDTQATGDIPVSIPQVTYSFPVLDGGGVSVCPIDYSVTRFDLSLFGGGNNLLFANEAALLSTVETLNPAGTDSYTFNAITCAVEVASATVPTVTTGNITATIASILYSFPVLDGGASACPIDYTTTSFDLTPFGGMAAETFSGEAALLSRMSILNAGSQAYIFDATACAVEVNSTTVPTVITGNINVAVTAPTTTYAFPVLDGGAAACPIDYANTTFDLTFVGGGATESFTGEAALLTQMGTLNDAGGQVYVFDATNCEVEVTSATAPAVTTGDIDVTVTIPTYSFPVLDGGAAACPIDYANTTFDLTFVGGGFAESFTGEAALLTQLGTLNDAGGQAYTFNGTTCEVEVTSATAPAVTTGNIDVTVTLSDQICPTLGAGLVSHRGMNTHGFMPGGASGNFIFWRFRGYGATNEIIVHHINESNMWSQTGDFNALDGITKPRSTFDSENGGATLEINWGDGNTDTYPLQPWGTFGSSTTSNIRHTYATPGDYPIVLTMTGENGSSFVQETFVHWHSGGYPIGAVAQASGGVFTNRNDCNILELNKSAFPIMLSQSGGEISNINIVASTINGADISALTTASTGEFELINGTHPEWNNLVVGANVWYYEYTYEFGGNTYTTKITDTFIVEADADNTYAIQILDSAGSPVAGAINFGTTTFDLTGWGGGAVDTFANGAALAAFFDGATSTTGSVFNAVNNTVENTSDGGNDWQQQLTNRNQGIITNI